MTLPTISEPPTTPVPPQRPGWVVPLLAAVALVLVATAAVTTWALTRSTGPATGEASATVPATFPVRGSLQLDDVGRGWPVGEHCSGTGGYGDVRDGAQVKVTDRAGALLAIGQLSAGVVNPHPTIDGAKTCIFSFTVSNVPTGRGLYGVEVSHRGVIQFEEAKLQDGSAALTLR